MQNLTITVTDTSDEHEETAAEALASFLDRQYTLADLLGALGEAGTVTISISDDGQPPVTATMTADDLEQNLR